MTQGELKEQIAKIILENVMNTDWKISLRVADQILALFPKVISEEEIEKIVSDILGVEGEKDLLRYQVWRKGAKDIAHALSGKLKPTEQRCECGRTLISGVMAIVDKLNEVIRAVKQLQKGRGKGE